MTPMKKMLELLDDYGDARQRDADNGEADNAGNVAGDALYEALMEDRRRFEADFPNGLPEPPNPVEL